MKTAPSRIFYKTLVIIRSKPSWGEWMFVLSYFFFTIYLFQLWREKIFDGDAIHIAIALQWLGHILGGKKWGGVAWGQLLLRVSRNAWPLIILWAAWSLAWGYLAIQRYYALIPGDFDLGVHTQTLWNLAHGRGFSNQLTVADTGNYLHDHQSFTLALFAPFYWTPYGTELALIAQALLFFLPGLGLALYTRQAWKTQFGESTAFLWAWISWFSWMLFSPLVGNTLWDFHETALSVPLLALWSWALAQGKTWIFLVSGILAGLTKEHFWVVLAPGLILYPLLHIRGALKNRLVGIIPWVFISGLFLAIFLLEQRFLARGINLTRYQHLGSTPGELLKRAISEPWIIFGILFEPQRLAFLHAILSPLLYTPAIAGWISLAWVPVFTIHAIGFHSPQFSTHFHYVTEIWAVASVIGWVAWSKLLTRFSNYRGWILATLASAIFWNAPTSVFVKGKELFNQANECKPARQQMRKITEQLVKACPGKPLIIATESAVPQLIHLAPLYTHLPERDQEKRVNLLRDFQAADCVIAVTPDSLLKHLENKLPGPYQIIETLPTCRGISYGIYRRNP